MDHPAGPELEQSGIDPLGEHSQFLGRAAGHVEAAIFPPGQKRAVLAQRYAGSHQGRVRQ